MKPSIKILLGITALSVVACSGNTEKTEDTSMGNESEMKAAEASAMTLNTDESKVKWEGTMLGMYSHSGTVDLAEGSLEMEGDNITGGTFVVDMTSMNPTDENYDIENNKTPEKLVGHLMSPDFFDVENHPKAMFEITGYDADKNEIMGNLTVRGNTNEEVVKNVSYDAASGTFSGKLTFDRTKYNVSFTHPMEEMVLSDDIELEIMLVAAN